MNLPTEKHSFQNYWRAPASLLAGRLPIIETFSNTKVLMFVFATEKNNFLCETAC